MNCSFPGCPRRSHSTGLCRAHRRQEQKGHALRPARPFAEVRPIADRLKEKVVVDPDRGCWHRPDGKCCNSWGYWEISFNGSTERAHRVAYQIAIGPIPDGLLVCHHCDNPSCINPDHLFLGTTKDNAIDRARKGRSGANGKPGQTNSMAKLKDTEVEEIRALRGTGLTHRAIAEKYGVSRSNIGMILSGKAHVRTLALTVPT